MFTAMIVGCSLEMGNCRVMAFPQPLPTLEVCLERLAIGYTQAVENGWTVMGYTCYHWDTDKDLKDLI
jgi:hypothetical protein